MGIAENIASLRNEIPRNVKLIAVSKKMPVHAIREAYNAGQRIFGENTVQELQQKHPLLPPDIKWHLIGHLQTNKVKAVLPLVSLIQSVDSLKLITEINREASKTGKVVNCLLQIRIAREETKFGMTFNDAVQMLASDKSLMLPYVRINGLMGIATFTGDTNQIRREFTELAGYFSILKNRFFAGDSSFKEISMGMSGDYKLGIDAGSTMVRIGTLIFGERNYGV